MICLKICKCTIFKEALSYKILSRNDSILLRFASLTRHQLSEKNFKVDTEFISSFYFANEILKDNVTNLKKVLQLCKIFCTLVLHVLSD